MNYQFNVRRLSPAHRLRASIYMMALLVTTSLAIGVVRHLRANSVSDTTPMEIVSMSLASNTVDVSSEPQAVQITGTIYEDLSGFESVYYHYTSPSGNQIVEGDLNGNSETIDNVIAFPQYAEEGEWTPTFTLVDVASNTRVYTAEELDLLGFSLNVNVTSTPSDTSAPELVEYSFEQSSVDTTEGEVTFTGNLTIDEDLSGINFNASNIIFNSPSSGQKVYGIIEPLTGNEYTFYAFFRQYMEVGDWEVTVQLEDAVGNTRFYDNTELVSMNQPESVPVSGTQDVTPISIDAMNFAAAIPPVGDQLPNSSKVTIFVELSDNLSGVASADILFRSQTTNQVAQVIPEEAAPGQYQYTVFMPPYAATGDWLPEMTTSDTAGNLQSYSHTDLVNLGYDLTLTLVKSEADTVVEDGTVSTDTGNDGATASDPFEASVTSPTGGEIIITQVALTDPVSANDYLVFDQQYDITAPPATAEDPLLFSFVVDSSSLQGQNASTISLFRNGELVEECTDAVQAIPDPCVAERNTLPGGDVEIVARSSHASVWALGYEAPTGPSYTFKNFKKLKTPPKLNEAEEGSTVSVKFDIGGDFGLNVLPAEIASSQRINCSTKAAIGDATPIVVNGNGLHVSGDDDDDDVLYKFKWKTLKKWEDTCRKLQLSFSNGEVVEVYFKFDD